MKRFGLLIGLVGFALLALAGWMNRPTDPAQGNRPMPAPMLAQHQPS